MERETNIPQQYQLLFDRFGLDKSLRMVNKSDLGQQSCDHPVSTYGSNKKYFIIDTRNVVLLDGQNKPKQCDIDNVELNKKWDVMRHYKLKILEYFDINKQRADVLQFLIYHKDLTYGQLCDYIENDFICINMVDNK